MVEFFINFGDLLTICRSFFFHAFRFRPCNTINNEFLSCIKIGQSPPLHQTYSRVWGEVVDMSTTNLAIAKFETSF
jgi:hypothetical protein